MHPAIETRWLANARLPEPTREVDSGKGFLQNDDQMKVAVVQLRPPAHHADSPAPQAVHTKEKEDDDKES